MYYNYHGKIRRLIAEGDIIGYRYVANYNGISPAIVFYFNSNRPMPIREYRFDEYSDILKTLKELK